MSIENFKVLLILGNESLGVQISEKIKQDLRALPLKVDYVTDARRGISDFRENMHQLIIVDNELPGTTGLQIIRDVRKIVGGVTILLLTKDEQEIFESGVDQVLLPIVNWSDFLSKVREVIPEELKAKFGFLKRDSLFFKKLEKYCEDFIQKNNLNTEFAKYKTSAPITVIPKYFDSTVEVQDVSNISPDDDGGQQIEIVELAKPNALLEICVLVVLLIMTVLVHTLEFFYSDEIMSLKNIISVTMILSFVGFFAAKIFDRYFINKIQ